MKHRYADWCTIYADASWSGLGRAGWSIWIRFGEPRPDAPHRIIRQGRCPPEAAADSTIAELYAIVQGVRIALQTWGDVAGLGVRSDCQGALEWARHDSRLSKRNDVRRLQEALRRMLAGRGARIACRWVRGHQGTRTTQGYLNHQVDALANRARKARRP